MSKKNIEWLNTLILPWAILFFFILLTSFCLCLQAPDQTQELLGMTEAWFARVCPNPFDAVWSIAKQPFSDLKVLMSPCFYTAAGHILTFLPSWEASLMLSICLFLNLWRFQAGEISADQLNSADFFLSFQLIFQFSAEFFLDFRINIIKKK